MMIDAGRGSPGALLPAVAIAHQPLVLEGFLLPGEAIDPLFVALNPFCFSFHERLRLGQC